MVELGNKIRAFRKERGWSLQDLADHISVDVSRQHLSKIETGTIKLSEFWMREIAAALGLADPADLLADRGRDLRQSEVVYRAPPSADTDPEVVKSVLYPGHPQSFWMQVSAPSLALAGVLPGDYLIVDPNISARRGDVVVVQSYDEARADAETRLLTFEPPFFMPRSIESRFQPVTTDDEAARVVGVVVCRYSRRSVAG